MPTMKSSSAFRLPKASDDEKRVRTAQIQEALRSATEVPLETMRASAEAIHAAADVAAFGNGNASSDVRGRPRVADGRASRREAECRDQPDEP